jgi:TetR/AcrR family transcriptional repressor of nem operon
MSRPREFDEATVLNAAVQCFWKNGYEATSVRDLASQMDLSVASLYNAFGDKQSLYWRSLEHYLDRTLRERIERCESGLPPQEAIRSFFFEVIDRSLNDRQRKGCMLVNAALEVTRADPEFQRVVAGALIHIEAFFYRCVLAGQRAGTISKSQRAEDLARFLLSILLGLRVLARAMPQRALLEGLVRPAFAVLEGSEQSKELVTQ